MGDPVDAARDRRRLSQRRVVCIGDLVYRSRGGFGDSGRALERDELADSDDAESRRRDGLQLDSRVVSFDD
jgi:hypothetical protein